MAISRNLNPSDKVMTTVLIPGAIITGALTLLFGNGWFLVGGSAALFMTLWFTNRLNES